MGVSVFAGPRQGVSGTWLDKPQADSLVLRHQQMRHQDQASEGQGHEE
jgi:hypothetical protein